MDGTMIGVIVAIVFNILISVFCAGKLYQKVGDLSNRISKLEKKVENTDTHIDNLAERIARIEGKLE